MAAKYDSTPVNLPAAADLSAKTWRFGKFTSSGVNVCTVAGEKAGGIIGCHYKKTPAAGDAIDFYIERIPLVEAGAAYSAGDPLTTDANGRAITATGSAAINAYAIDAASLLGDVGRVILPSGSVPLASNVSDSQTGVGSLVGYTFSIADAADADYDRVIAEKFEVLYVIVQKRGGAGGASATVTVKNGTDAITDAIDINDADKVISLVGTIDDAFSTVAAAGTLRCSVVDGGNSSILVTVIGVKRA